MKGQLRNTLFTSQMLKLDKANVKDLHEALHDTLCELGPMDVISDMTDEEFAGLSKFLSLVQTNLDFNRGRRHEQAVQG